jgi:hypothetical protein
VQYTNGAAKNKKNTDKKVRCIIFSSNVFSLSDSVLRLSLTVRMAPTTTTAKKTAEYETMMDTNLNTSLPVIKNNRSNKL